MSYELWILLILICHLLYGFFIFLQFDNLFSVFEPLFVQHSTSFDSNIYSVLLYPIWMG